MEQLPAAIFLLFVASQSVYFVVNLAAIAFLYLRPVNLVGEREPTTYRDVHVLLAIRGERRRVVEETVAALYEQRYPDERIHVYPIYESDDEIVADYVDELGAEATERGWDVTPWSVDRDGLSYYLEASGQLTDGGRLPRTKAAALSYAFATLSLDEDDVVTVSDADTGLPKDVLQLGVSGLETYDVVQAKQTVRNIDNGWLPTLEAMGIAAWSNAIYARTSRGPYQLLGKGYFVEVGTLFRLGNWDAKEVTEDMALGVNAHVNGCTLGIIDRYVQDLCPARFGDWVKQKRRWVLGPYAHLLSDRFSWLDRVRFWTFTVANQLVSVTNVVGVPAGAAMLYYTAVDGSIAFPWPLSVVVGVNLLSWLYYSLLAYVATSGAVRFESRREKIAFYVRSNPLTQIVYATLWVIPITGALLDTVRRKVPVFEVTPK